MFREFLLFAADEAMDMAAKNANGAMPNIPFPTMGGEVMWNVLDRNNDWVLQQNCLTQLCRILDEDNIRRAWGTREAMESVFRSMSDNG